MRLLFIARFWVEKRCNEKYYKNNAERGLFLLKHTHPNVEIVALEF